MYTYIMETTFILDVINRLTALIYTHSTHTYILCEQIVFFGDAIKSQLIVWQH